MKGLRVFSCVQREIYNVCFLKIVAMVLRISDNIIHPCTLSMLNPCALTWMGIIENGVALISVVQK